MTIKDGLRTLLLAETSITMLAPAQTVDRQSVPAIFVDKVMQGFRPPFIVIKQTGFTPLHFVSETTSHGTANIDIHCLEFTEPEAEALAAAVATYLKNFSGAAGSTTIIYVTWTDTQYSENDEGDGRDVWRHAATLSFEIFY